MQTDSKINLLRNDELSTAEDIRNGEHFVNNIIDDIFAWQREHYEESDSDQLTPSSRSIGAVDRRLLYWKNMLAKRRALQLKLCQATGKQPNQLLINQSNREEQTMKRILDYAERKDTLHNHLEIVDLPEHTAKEVLGEAAAKKKLQSKWLNSKLVADHIAAKMDDIGDVLEMPPEIRNLQLIGKNRWHKKQWELTSIQSISSLTACSDIEWHYELALDTSFVSNRSKTSVVRSQLAVHINGTTYRPCTPEFSPILEKMFMCKPYERILRTVMRIENNGISSLQFTWERDPFFARNNRLFNTKFEEFLLDTEPFILRVGEVREVSVLYSPRKVGIIKQRWLLITYPAIFHCTPYALTLNMHGRCRAPPEYLELLEARQKLPKRDCEHREKILQLQRPTYPPWSTLCPFVRELSECEAFNRRNPGFHCSCSNDIEEIRRFFTQLKPQCCSLNWDYSVRMLIELMCAKRDQRLRITLFEQLQSLLAKLRGRATNLALQDDEIRLRERGRTRLIYVRGVISNNIETWLQTAWQLDQQMLKLATDTDQMALKPKSKSKSKRFRNALYLYTYDQVCATAEDIASVIESTENF